MNEDIWLVVYGEYEQHVCAAFLTEEAADAWAERMNANEGTQKYQTEWVTLDPTLPSLNEPEVELYPSHGKIARVSLSQAEADRERRELVDSLDLTGE